MKTLRIGLVGDRNDEYRAHVALPRALALAAKRAECEVEPAWIATRELGAMDARAVAERLEPFAAIWCAPGSPYASMDGALSAIRFARERHVPFVGTCGGFQHAVLEHARHVLGMPEADHAESSPDAKLLLLTRLVCPLVKKRGHVSFVPGSKWATIYGAADAEEEFHCNFGVNPEHRAALENGALRFTAHDADGDVRALELTAHPFFLASLFQFELSALRDETHPIVVALLRAAAGRSG